MPRNQKKHISWGSITAYAFFGVYIIMIGLGATFHWRALDLAFAFLTLAAVAVGSAIVLWHGWQHRGEPRGYVLVNSPRYLAVGKNGFWASETTTRLTVHPSGRANARRLIQALCL
jgi:hypothetical protein